MKTTWKPERADRKPMWQLLVILIALQFAMASGTARAQAGRIVYQGDTLWTTELEVNSGTGTLIFSHTGDWLACIGNAKTGGDDGRLFIVNSKTGEIVGRQEESTKFIFPYFSGDDSKLYVGDGADQTINCFSVPDLKLLWKKDFHFGSFLWYDVTDDGKYLINEFTVGDELSPIGAGYRIIDLETQEIALEHDYMKDSGVVAAGSDVNKYRSSGDLFRENTGLIFKPVNGKERDTLISVVRSIKTGEVVKSWPEGRRLMDRQDTAFRMYFLGTHTDLGYDSIGVLDETKYPYPSDTIFKTKLGSKRSEQLHVYHTFSEDFRYFIFGVWGGCEDCGDSHLKVYDLQTTKSVGTIGVTTYYETDPPFDWRYAGLAVHKGRLAAGSFKLIMFNLEKSLGTETPNEDPSTEDERIYPNPTGAIATIRVGVPAPVQATVLVADTGGRILYRAEPNLTPPSTDIVIPCHALSSGRYLVSVRTNSMRQSYTLIINR